MYDKALAIEILQQILQALRTILQRFEPVKSSDDFTGSPAGMEKRIIRQMSTLGLQNREWTWQEPCCLTPLRQRKEVPDHVHLDTVPCFWTEGYSPHIDSFQIGRADFPGGDDRRLHSMSQMRLPPSQFQRPENPMVLHEPHWTQKMHVGA